MPEKSQNNSFSHKIRSILWPIEKSELKVFLPMACLMFCILFNFSALRSVKDSLVVPSIGAEVISFLKLWLVLPVAIIFTIVYVRLSNVMQMEYIFYVIVSLFLSVYLIFAYILYPSQEYYHPSQEFIDRLLLQYPYLQWFIKLLSKWSYATIYIFAELWSVVVINLMFWQFANHIIATQQARRFYPMFGFIGNTGLILAGNALVLFVDFADGETLTQNVMGYETLSGSPLVLKLIVGAIAFFGILAMFLFRYLNQVVLNDKGVTLLSTHDIHDTQTKLSFSESIKLIMSSKYIGYIVVMIICYSFVINMLEGPWKAKIKEMYPTTLEYISFMGQFNVWMGICSVSFMIIGGNLLRCYSWLIAALITPSIIGITGTAFFAFVVFPEYFSSTLGIFGFNPLYAAIIVGALQNILSKSTKYSLFDSTKEMAYIPLSRELRTKGKAAAEVIGTKLGKSLGAFVQSMIFTFSPSSTFDSMSSILMVIFIFVIMLWFTDVKKLGSEYIKLGTQN